MVTYSYDHIHLRSRHPLETARYFNKMFGAEIKESVQSDGQSRVDIDINGLVVFIAQAEDTTPDGPHDPYVGLDHFGLRVDNLEAAATELKAKGAESPWNPRTYVLDYASHLYGPLETFVSNYSNAATNSMLLLNKKADASSVGLFVSHFEPSRQSGHYLNP